MNSVQQLSKRWSILLKDKVNTCNILNFNTFGCRIQKLSPNKIMLKHMKKPCWNTVRNEMIFKVVFRCRIWWKYSSLWSFVIKSIKRIKWLCLLQEMSYVSFKIESIFYSMVSTPYILVDTSKERFWINWFRFSYEATTVGYSFDDEADAEENIKINK